MITERIVTMQLTHEMAAEYIKECKTEIELVNLVMWAYQEGWEHGFAQGEKDYAEAVKLGI